MRKANKSLLIEIVVCYMWITLFLLGFLFLTTWITLFPRQGLACMHYPNNIDLSFSDKILGKFVIRII